MIIARYLIRYRLGDFQGILLSRVGEGDAGDGGGSALIFAHVLAEDARDGKASIADRNPAIALISCVIGGLCIGQNLGYGVLYPIVDELEGEVGTCHDLA